MKLRELVDAYGAQISAGYESGRYAGFAPAEETLGFISTDGSAARGLVFMCDRLRTDLDGTVRQAEYTRIEAVEILDSGEGAYADELLIKAGGEPLRVSDCSLDKHRLKALIDELCRESRAMPEGEREDVYNEAMSAAAEHFSAMVKPEEHTIPEEYVPAQIPDERIDWLSNSNDVPPAREDDLTEEPAVPDEPVEPVKPTAPAEPAPSAEPVAEVQPELWEETEEPPVIPEYFEEEQEDLSELSHEETISYLLSSLSEINTPAAQADIPPESGFEEETAQAQPEEPRLTEEPISDDIYIKASRKLREFCELGTLTQQGIEAAVKEGLIPAAEAFAAVTAQIAAPQPLAGRIEELRAASGSMDRYFALGEDVAARVMFFMLYQMLSYSDRLRELPETKERLNDFFRRWGAAGITLSMLDMRIQ